MASIAPFFRLVPALAVLGISVAPSLAEGGIGVSMNQAKIVKLSAAADTVVIGNPGIADASVQDARTLILTGRGFGTTNVVVLDAKGQTILDDQVVVSRENANSVRVYRRASVQTLSCTPYCEGSFRSDAERQSDLEIGAN